MMQCLEGCGLSRHNSVSVFASASHGTRKEPGGHYGIQVKLTRSGRLKTGTFQFGCNTYTYLHAGYHILVNPTSDVSWSAAGIFSSEVADSRARECHASGAAHRIRMFLPLQRHVSTHEDRRGEKC
jgi:hypothetical protein